MAPAQSGFKDIPATAEWHFRLLFYAAVLCLLAHLERQASQQARPGKRPRRFLGCLYRPDPQPDTGKAAPLAEFPFLQHYIDELGKINTEKGWEELSRSWQARVRDWEKRLSCPLPLRGRDRELGLAFADRLLLILIGLVEEDIRFGALFAKLQAPLPGRRPCLGLLTALAQGDRGRSTDAWASIHTLLRTGLIRIDNLRAPRADWVPRVPAELWPAIHGRVETHHLAHMKLRPQQTFPSLDALTIAPDLHDGLERLPELLETGQVDALILRGMAGSGRRTLFGSLARILGRDLLLCNQAAGGGDTDAWSLLGPLSSLSHAFPVVCVDPGPGEKVALPVLDGYRGPLGVIMRCEGGVNGPALRRALTLKLPNPDEAQRCAIWRTALGERAGPDMDGIVERFLLPTGSIFRVADMAVGQALLAKRDHVTMPDVQLAYRSLDRQALDTLAQRLEGAGDWGQVVVNDATTGDLDRLERRCRQRERLLRQVGKHFPNAVNRGVRALFTGPSGTGKTLAARTLAAVLNMDIYRVDLAAVVNKYIGETEKQLSRLLARAEELDVILLIDEGDALMTKRTDVKSANDRYANMETNYLLQRLETYMGIVVVTTNAGKRIDAAFQRRFDAVVDFIPPDPLERWQIWQLHLPRGNQVGAACLERVSRVCAMTGGQIRNAATHAVMLALEAGPSHRVGDSDLQKAVMREYRKSGAAYPLAADPNAQGVGVQQAQLARFLGSLG